MPPPTASKFIPLPRHWSEHLRSGVLHAISIAQTALTCAWARAASRSPARRHPAEIDCLRAEPLASARVGEGARAPPRYSSAR
jgi:hypothetical protein